MLGEFFEWWGGQLAGLVPSRWRQRTGGSDALVVDSSEPGLLTLRRRRRGAEQRLTQLRTDEPGHVALRAALNGRPRGEPVVLRLAPAQLLERAVTLPLAAERDLDRVLGYEMERLTPFTANEVFWACAVRVRDRARARLLLRLTIVPCASVAGVMDLLAASGARPVQLEAAAADGPQVIRLAHASPSAGSRLVRRALAGTAGLLALLVLVLPFLRQSLALAEIGERLDQMAPRIAQVDTLRHRIAGAGAGGDAVAAETRRLGDTLLALAAVTEILPDDSYLTEFTMRERHMTLSGLGASAPKLISLLSADPRIRGPAFTAPVTRSETNHLDVFSIRAELAQ